MSGKRAWSPKWPRKPAWPPRWATRGTRAMPSAQTCEWIWDGAIGDVREVHAWTNASRWNTEALGRTPPTEPCPKGVNWDLWLGPREPRALTARLTPRLAGAISGISAPRRSATSSATTSIPPSGRWICANRSASKPSAPAGWIPTSPRRRAFTLTSSARAAKCRRSSSPGTKAA